MNPADYGLLANKHAASLIDHVGMAVRDIDEAQLFYTRELGLTVDGGRIDLRERSATVQFLRAGTSGVELLMPTSESGALARFIAKRGEGLHHVCFTVGDIHDTVRRLQQRGITMADHEPWRSPHGWAAYIHPASAHGCAVELREHYR